MCVFNFRWKVHSDRLFITFTICRFDVMYRSSGEEENHHTRRVVLYESPKMFDVSASEVPDHFRMVRSWCLKQIIMHEILHGNCSTINRYT